MRLLSNLFSDQGKRASWEAGLSWFRLRYTADPTRAINLLSRPEACGRVALYYRPADPVSQLYLGLPERHSRLLERMAADFGFSLAPKPPEVTIPPAQPLTAISDLPWNKAFIAHIAGEVAFVSGETSGRYLPQPPGPTSWQLPPDPPPGLSLRPAWNGIAPLVPDTFRLTPGRVNVYGRQERVADWLVKQVTELVSADAANLVVVDGKGDLLPRLKRKSTITARLGQGLAYLDLDGPAVSGGFNPLAAGPGEPESHLPGRWQQWFAGMGVPQPALDLLPLARQEGVGDIPGLRRWLKQNGRQGRPAAAALMLALKRLTVDETLKEWLDWPTNRFSILPRGALLFACRDSGWAQRQLLRAVFLALGDLNSVRLVVHGVPWQEMAFSRLPSIVLSNGPRLVNSRLVITGCHARGAAVLADRFFKGDPATQENLELLGPGQALLVIDDKMASAKEG